MASTAELIPNDICKDIFLRLDVRNLIRCTSVCKSWKSLISGSQLIFKAHFCWYDIFLRLDARNLTRCKSVCQSWKSLISDSHFIKVHLNHSYNSNENGHKRIGEAVFLIGCDTYYMIGSSNGLVCILDSGEPLVANPLTREVKPVPKPFDRNISWYNDDIVCGFGYDSLKDDYKIVFGVKNGEYQTCFHVFSLKSNAWHVIENVKYTCDYLLANSSVGVLCNGAIYWVMHPENQETKEVILSFDLSKEEFKEIPQPNYPLKYLNMGIMEECICVLDSQKLWVMKKYNEELSWEIMDKDNYQLKFEYPVYYVEDFKVRNGTFTGDLTFKSNILESLVSPHLQLDNE